MRILIILLFISFVSFAQEDIERFKLYPTENINGFLKLNTSTGEVWLVQKRSSQVESGVVKVQKDPLALDSNAIVLMKLLVNEETNLWTEIDTEEERVENPIPLSATYTDVIRVAKIGRYKLYPSENIYTVLLQDVMEGTTFQLQWIPDNIQFFELD